MTSEAKEAVDFREEVSHSRMYMFLFLDLRDSRSFTFPGDGEREAAMI